MAFLLSDKLISALHILKTLFQSMHSGLQSLKKRLVLRAVSLWQHQTVNVSAYSFLFFIFVYALPTASSMFEVLFIPGLISVVVPRSLSTSSVLHENKKLIRVSLLLMIVQSIGWRKKEFSSYCCRISEKIQNMSTYNFLPILICLQSRAWARHLY